MPHASSSRAIQLLSTTLAAVFVVAGCDTLASEARVPQLESIGARLASALPAGETGARRERVVATPATQAAAALERPPTAATPKPEATPAPVIRRLRPRPAPGPFAIDLYREGDFVHQATKDWCVAGSTATMMNIIGKGKPRRSAAFQRRLYERGRQLSPLKGKLGPIGVDLLGWAELLNKGGYGPYVVDGAATLEGAIRKSARALRVTGRPVGLVTWRGAHSWVMSGFTATADPAFSRDFLVKKVHIQDTWYPYVSTIWGASRPPDTLVPVAALAEDYLPYRRPSHRWPRRDGRYMLILPQLPEGTVAR